MENRVSPICSNTFNAFFTSEFVVHCHHRQVLLTYLAARKDLII